MQLGQFDLKTAAPVRRVPAHLPGPNDDLGPQIAGERQDGVECPAVGEAVLKTQQRRA